jgi:hypothetical protein
MKCQLLGGVAVSVLVLATASSAWANPKNSFSDYNTTTVNSTATAATAVGSQDGSDPATAISESYNTSNEGVSSQSLNGVVTDNYIDAFWDYDDESTTGNANVGGNASVGGFENAAGVNVASAGTGSQSLNQQAVSLGVVGTVNFNQNQ